VSQEEATSSDRQFPWWHGLLLICAGTLGGLWLAAGTAFFGRLAFCQRRLNPDQGPTGES